MTKLISLTQNKFSIVDDDIFDQINKFTWRAMATQNHQNFYAGRGIRVNKRKTTLLLHRYIWYLKTNQELTSKQQIDHIDHDGLNNKMENLRLASFMQNQHNRQKSKLLKTTSIYKGVHWDKENKRWHATLRVNRQKIFLGCFLSENEAAKVYDTAAKRYFGEYALLNFGDKI